MSFPFDLIDFYVISNGVHSTFKLRFFCIYSLSVDFLFRTILLWLDKEH